MDNITHDGQLTKSDDDHGDDQMDMMMMTAMMQLSNDVVLNFGDDQNSHHHHHHHHQHFMNLLSTVSVSSPPLISDHHHQAPVPQTSRSIFPSGGGTINRRSSGSSSPSPSSVAALREMIFRIAVMQPVHIDPESVKPPKRRNVRISKDPQSVAARHRRERISERIRILQRLVPGGTKMDTASMLDEAIHYVKFLKTQVQSLERASSSSSSSATARPDCTPTGIGFPVAMSTGAYISPHHKGFGSSNQLASFGPQNVQCFGDMID